MSKTIDKTKEIASIIKDTECTEAEAEEIFAIEEKARQNGSAKVYVSSDTKRKPTKRERKPDMDKREIIQTLDEALTDLVDNVTVTNIEREIQCTYNDMEYSVILTKHRQKKGEG